MQSCIWTETIRAQPYTYNYFQERHRAKHIEGHAWNILLVRYQNLHSPAICKGSLMKCQIFIMICQSRWPKNPPTYTPICHTIQFGGLISHLETPVSPVNQSMKCQNFIRGHVHMMSANFLDFLTFKTFYFYDNQPFFGKLYR